ncbi:MAG TPA: hypothetical protein VK797_23345 [Tepidisphaeraceae bacterium]|jgi:hypothetical protein|nr:hypothetical protein [Tepidisphaeraceae bacterium]
MIRRLPLLLIPLFALAFSGCALPPPTVVSPTTLPATTQGSGTVAPVVVVAPTPSQQVVASGVGTWFSQNLSWLIPLILVIVGGNSASALHALSAIPAISKFFSGPVTPQSTAQAATAILPVLAQMDPKDAALFTKLQNAAQVIQAGTASPAAAVAAVVASTPAVAPVGSTVTVTPAAVTTAGPVVPPAA